MKNLESRNIPSVFIASDEFMAAAAAQSSALGIDPSAIFIPHPIQDRTDEEMAQLAEEALDDILKQLTG